MFAPDRPNRRFYAVAPDDDVTTVTPGSAIPQRYRARPVPGRAGVPTWLFAAEPLAVVALLLAAIGLFTFETIEFPRLSAAVAAPTVVVEEPSTGKQRMLTAGAEPLLAQPDFFVETHAAFVEAETTFIEADLDAMEIRLYEAGVEVFSAPIVAKGRSGSWWETPAGLYEVQAKRPDHQSSFGNVSLPWSLPFQGNFFIHGIPEYSDGTPVDGSFSGGCIRLMTADAETLFEQVAVGTPVLVHEPTEPTTAFQYEPSLPDMAAPHYVLADIEDQTILASSALDDPAPIASITKLMTALVAVEYINLDTRVSVGSGNMIQSIIPRLAERQRVSMYSLLQLLLIESSNEAAEIIADQIGRETFVARMNEKADAIGMHQTTFVDPSGLSSDNVSTLSDLLRLARYIHTNRSFLLELTADQYLPTPYPADEFGELENFNRLADLDDFYGGKVGQTAAAGSTSLTLHTIPVGGTERTIAIIILGSSDRTADALQLHQYFHDRFVR